MTSQKLKVADARAAIKAVESKAVALEMFSTDYEGDRALIEVGERRRRIRAGLADPVSTVALVLNEEGVLLWRDGEPVGPSAGSGVKRGKVSSVEGELVELYQFEKLEPNKVQRSLDDLDSTLNPVRGLFPMTLVPAQGSVQATVSIGPKPFVPNGRKRRLLFVHGTFSAGHAFRDGFARAPRGGAFLTRLFAHYDEVLSFEHPTLSVSPVLNAFDLFRLMAAAEGPLDIVAHSRGGLVARWFLEGFGGPPGTDPQRGILVGSPLGGTSLASPPRLRDALGMISNFGTVLKVAGAAASAFTPLLIAPLILLRVATSAVQVGANTPLLDSAISMIPGLAGQSRVKDNPELVRLFALQSGKPPEYSLVRSNFQTERAGWQFWKWFRADKLKDVGADKVFPGDNDLVVDTSSMIQLVNPAQKPNGKRLCDFGTSATVHHTNYFEQSRTLDFITDRFGVK